MQMPPRVSTKPWSLPIKKIKKKIKKLTKHPHWSHSCHLLPEKIYRATELMQDFINSSYHA
jgi:hypothetical protein